MTDKELIKQEIIRLKNEQLSIFSKGENDEICGTALICIGVYNQLLSFINSLSEEPISENKSEKELAETYLAVFDKKHPILPTLKGKQKADFKNFLNKCQQEFGLKEFGIHPTQSKLFEKLTLLWATWGAEHLEGLGKSNQDEFDKMSVSEDLEEEIKAYIRKSGWDGLDSDESVHYIAYHFAEWQKQQMKETLQTEYEKGRFDMKEEMMKDAVGGVVHHFADDELAAVHYNDPKDTPMSMYISSKGLSAGDKVKIIIVKEEQQ